MGVTHKPKAGALLTGTEYEAADSHITSIAHVDTTGITATDHHAAPVAGPDANVTVDSAGAAGAAGSFARSGHGHQVVSYASTPAAIGTAAAGTSGTAPSRGDHVHATGAGTPSTQAFGDAASTGTGPAGAMTDHKHAMPANPVSFASPTVVLGSSAAAGAASTVIRSDSTIAAFDATNPTTQAMGDAAAVGSAAFAARRDHKHAMPALGFGLTSNSTPAVSLTTASAFVTATTSVSAATYADITGATVTLATGTWLVIGNVYGSSVNAQAIMHVAITDASNAVIAEGSQGIGASGTASVGQLGNVTVCAIVSATGAAIKLRAARGLTTITGTWVAMNGAGTNTTNNLTDGSNKGTGIFAVRIA